MLEKALRSRPAGPNTLQAAIASVHAEARDAAGVDWAQIVGLYDLLLRCSPSPVVELNRGVAIAMRDTPQAGLKAVDAILARGELRGYYLLHSQYGPTCSGGSERQRKRAVHTKKPSASLDWSRRGGFFKGDSMDCRARAK